jgi:hypothetical protein
MTLQEAALNLGVACKEFFMDLCKELRFNEICDRLSKILSTFQ